MMAMIWSRYGRMSKPTISATSPMALKIAPEPKAAVEALTAEEMTSGPSW